MPTCRCKMCGGQIHYGENDSVAKCEFCGTEQTVVRTDDAKQLNLFNRANSLRLQNEFDKAQTTYENILIDDPNNAEAHWGICLCRYGIEYVDDKKTNKKVPTCHRTVFNFIFDDIDYQEAIKNADVVAKKMYQNEAKVIDKIQKNILSISQKEDPYDIFICYKETDENGKRTKDSIVAQEIYDELINRGYKVFFSRISLESKIGSDYEPIIFAALMSSKVMIAIGSKVEFFNSPWVKNEWGRFLSFMKDQHGKYLIPCYFDMEAYDMPEEFLMLQAQDIGKVGYLQDLSRGIDKIFDRTRKVVTEVKIENSGNASSPKIDNMLKRVKLSLEDQEWVKANGIIEDILNIDVECAEAYLYKILVEYRVKNVDELINKNEPLDNDKNYNRALRFASDEYREYLVEINKTIKERIENLKKETIYRDVIQFMGNGNYIVAMNSLKNLHDYKDSEKLREECYKKCYEIALDYKSSKNYDEAINVFNSIRTYKDSLKQIDECKELKLYENEKNTCLKICNSLEALIVKIEKTHEITDQNRNSYNTGLKTLSSIKLYADAEDKCRYYLSKLNELENEIKEYKIQQEEERKRKAEKRKKLIIFWSKLGSVIAVCLVAIILLTTLLFVPMGKYNKAQSCINKGEYKKASDILSSINYKDSKKQVQLLDARNYLELGDYESAINIVYNMGGTTNVNYEGEGNLDKESEIIKKAKYITTEGEKIGSKFTGWKLNEYEIDYKKHSLSLSLEATYERIEYKITYENIVGEQNIYSYYYGGYYSITNPKKYGYTFLGWNVNGSTELYKDYEISNTQYGDITLKANWELSGFIITIDTNGGELDVSKEVAVMYGDNYNLPIPTREGYTFLGYVLDGDYITDESGESIDNYSYDENKTVVADWSINSYRITFTAQTGGTVSKDFIISEYNAPISVSAYTAVSYNHTFVGWYLDNELISEFSTLSINTPAKEVCYVARFVEFKITTSKNYNDAGTITVYENTSVIAGKSVSITAETSHSSNGIIYAFYGWMCEGQLIDSSNSTTIIMPKKNVEYVAKWIKIEVNSNYDVAEINFSKENITAPSDSVTISAMYPSEYNFVGWYISNTKVSSSMEYDYTTTSSDENIILRLEQNTLTINSDFGNVFIDSKTSYTIKCNCNNGESVKTYTITYGSISSIPVPTKSGFAFAGWYTDSSLNNKFNFNSTIYDDLMLYAKWVQASINYIYDYTSESPFSIAAINFVQNSASFTSLTTGKYKLYYKLASENTTSVSITNTTTSKNLASFGASSSIYNYVEIDLVEGNMYSISVHSTFNNCYVALYLNGEKPNFTPNCYFNNFELGEPMLVPKDTILKLSIGDIPSDKMFGGWYLNGEAIAYSLSFDLNVPEGNSVLTAQFLVDSDLIGFEYEIVDNQIIITGIEDKTVKNIVVPDFVYGISEGAFNGCSLLESITLPFIGDREHLLTDTYQYPLGYIFGTTSYEGGIGTSQEYYTTRLGEYGYYYIPATLKEVVVTRSNYIQHGAFYKCSNLTNITLPNSVVSIEGYAFRECKGLTSFTIPNSVESIKSCAFLECSSLTSIVIPDSVKNIESNAFSECYGIVSVKVSENNIYYDSRMNCNAIIHTSTNKLIMGCKTTVIPNNVTIIGGGAFSGCKGLTNIIIPNNIISIESAAFSGCTGLTNIIIPDTITTIGIGVFSCCSNLESISIPDSVTSIKSYAFEMCTKLVSIVIPNSVTFIDDYAFYGSSSLLSVYYKGNDSNWNEIEIGTIRNEPLNEATIYYYSETEPSEIGNYWRYVNGKPTIW